MDSSCVSQERSLWRSQHSCSWMCEPRLPFLFWLLIVYTHCFVSLLLTSCPQECYCVAKYDTAIQNIKPYYSQANTSGLCVFSAREDSVMHRFSCLSSTGAETPQHCPALRLPGEWCHVTVVWSSHVSVCEDVVGKQFHCSTFLTCRKLSRTSF